MTQTYWQLKEKITALQAQAEALKLSERADVIAKTRATIEDYGLTAKDLFGAKAAPAPRAKGAAKRVAVKFADGKGNVWGGRGPRPQWIRAALESGAKLNDLLAGRASAGEAKAADAQPAAVPAEPKAKSKAKANAKAVRKAANGKPAAKQKVAAKFRDETGNTWSGRGLQPRWLKAAIGSGKKLEDFAI